MLDAVTLLDASLLPAMFIAILAGLLSFLSPCVLPIVPPYLAYMGGVSVTDMDSDTAARRRVLVAALFFVMGLSTVFIFLGMAVSALGRAFLQYQDMFIYGAGIVVMIFGAHFLGVIRIGFLQQEARIDAGDKGGSSFGAYVLGLAFAFGWTPCIGPILGAILGTGPRLRRMWHVVRPCWLPMQLGWAYHFCWSRPFFPRLKGAMGWMKRHMDRIERVSGLMLWTVGLMMLTGQFTAFSYWLLEQFPALAVLG